MRTDYESSFAILASSAKDAAERRRRRLAKKLISFTELNDGWSYGEGEPISRFAVAVAQQFLFLGARLQLKVDVFPNLDGGCAVAFYRNHDCVEISVRADGRSVGIKVERGRGPDYDEPVPPRDEATIAEATTQVLSLLPEDEWTLLVSSTSDSTIPNADASVTLF